MEKIQEFIQNHLVDIIIFSSCIFFIFGCWLLYTANRTANDNYNVTQSIQQAERDNREARRAVNSASAEIGKAEIKLNDGIKRTDEISETVKRTKERTDGNAEIARECEDVIKASRNDLSEARTIFADIDARNKITGAQANSD